MKPILTLCFLIALGCCSQPILQEDKNATLLLKKIVSVVEEQHLKPKTIDNTLSKEVFDFYLSQIDPNKEFLTQKDVASLQQYESQIDEELTNGTFVFFNQALQQLKKGIQKAEKYSQIAVNSSLDFSFSEQLEIQSDKLKPAANDKALKERWRKMVKYMVLEQLWTIQNQSPTLGFGEQKKRAVEHVKRLLTSRFQKTNAFTKQERLHQYVNSFLKVHDVQTEYLSKEQKEKWNEDFTRTLVGIGTRLQIIDEYPQVMELTIGGPAWKSQRIEEGDVILKIGELNQAPLDAMGMSIEKVISLLRGKTGTTVQLTVKKANAIIEEIPIARAKIDLDRAMCFLLEDKLQKKKIGYIRLPRFYVGEEGSAADVLTHIELLNEKGIEGIVFDVRNNKGGASRQAIKIMGYFLEGGIVMQGQYRNGTERILEDSDETAQYKGQLLVLTNSRSGSASELFAGTMQDYQRAVIVGGKATFGKGTIQQFVDLETTTNQETHRFGEIKMTVGKFFTASGRSPQYKGIQPDIILPDDDAFVKSGERTYEYSIPHRNLSLTNVSPSVVSSIDLEKLKKLHLQRLKTNERFQLATKKALSIKEGKGNNLLSLDYKRFKLNKEKTTQEKEVFEEIFSPIEGFKISILPQLTTQQDSASILQNQRWIQALQKDPYVYECFWIVSDMLG